MVQPRKNIETVATLLCTTTVRGPSTKAYVRHLGISMVRKPFRVSIAFDYGALVSGMDMCFGRNLDGQNVILCSSRRR